jgi:D-apionolactonase
MNSNPGYKEMPCSPDPNVLFYGEPRPPASPVYGVIGPFSFVFQDGMLKHLRIGEVEIARRIYFTLRDKDWDTINPVISDLEIWQTNSLFEATWKGRCRKGDEIDYVWRGRVEVKGEGIVRFRTSGHALKEFSTPRVGICLLLSSAATLGKSYEVTHLDGERKTRVFEPIFPRTQPAPRWRSLRFSPGDWIQVEYSIEGSYFDMEDQRNFGDVSYKAMAGMPYEDETARVGQELGQTLTVRMTASKELPRATPRETFQTVRLRIGPELTRAKVPLLGVNCRNEIGDLDEVEHKLLARLNGFLYFSLDPQADALDGQVRRISSTTARTGKGVYLTVYHLTSENQARLTTALRQLASNGVKILQMDYAGSAQPELFLLRDSVREASLSVPVGKMAAATFQERERLLEAAEAEADFLAWYSTPISHQDDDETLMENASIYPHQTQTARSFAPGMPISIGPIQFNRHGYAPRPDPRYEALIAAAFVATSIKYLAEAGVRLGTFFDAVGPEGHTYRRSACLQPYYDDNADPQVFPSYQVLRIFGQWSGDPLFQVTSSDFLRVEACGIRTGHGRVVLVINQTPGPVQILVEGLTPAQCRARVCSLDETTFPGLRVASEGAPGGLPEVEMTVQGGQLALILYAYAVTLIQL